MDELTLSPEAMAALKLFAVERGCDVDSDSDADDGNETSNNGLLSKIQNHFDIRDKNDEFQFKFEPNVATEHSLGTIEFTLHGLKKEIGQTLNSTGLTL